MTEESLEHKLEDTAIDMEVASIKIYERLLESADTPHDRRIYREILNDEKDHERKVKQIRSNTRKQN